MILIDLDFQNVELKKKKHLAEVYLGPVNISCHTNFTIFHITSEKLGEGKQ